MKRSINLIPFATRRRVAARQLIRVGSNTSVITGVCLVALIGLEWGRAVSAARRLVEMKAQYAPVMRIVDEHNQLASQVKRLEAREQLANRLVRDVRGIALLSAVAEASRSAERKVYLERLSYRSVRSNKLGDRDPARAVSLTGVGLDGIAIAGFTASLRDSRVFDAVSVESTSPLTGGDASVRRFVVNGSL